MLRPRFLVTAFFTVMSVLVTSQGASAAFIATYQGVTGDALTYKLGASTSSVTAGKMGWKVTSSGGGEGFANNESFSAFCIQLQGLNNTQTFTKKDLKDVPTEIVGMGTAKANKIKELWARRVMDNANFLTAFSAIQLAAFQVAIWEIIYETSNTLNVTANNGNFSITSNGTNDATIISTANTWLGELNGTKTIGLVGLDSYNGANLDVGQDQVWWDGDPQNGPQEVEAVPAPPAVILAGLGVVSMLGLRARRMAARKAIA